MTAIGHVAKGPLANDKKGKNERNYDGLLHMNNADDATPVRMIGLRTLAGALTALVVVHTIVFLPTITLLARDEAKAVSNEVMDAHVAAVQREADIMLKNQEMLQDLVTEMRKDLKAVATKDDVAALRTMVQQLHK